MRLREFIKINRADIDRYVRDLTTHHYLQPQTLTSDREREEWVRNDEGLYRWAQSEGCTL